MDVRQLPINYGGFCHSRALPISGSLLAGSPGYTGAGHQQTWIHISYSAVSPLYLLILLDAELTEIQYAV